MLGITSPPVSSIEFIMARYSIRRRSGDDWYSPPFYTGPEGYKMCLRVEYSVRRNDVYAYVHLMRGEYDSQLVWPFKGDITIQLVNHSNDRDHCETTVLFNRIASGSSASKRVTSRESYYRKWW